MRNVIYVSRVSRCFCGLSTFTCRSRESIWKSDISWSGRVEKLSIEGDATCKIANVPWLTINHMELLRVKPIWSNIWNDDQEQYESIAYVMSHILTISTANLIYRLLSRQLTPIKHGKLSKWVPGYVMLVPRIPRWRCCSWTGSRRRGSPASWSRPPPWSSPPGSPSPRRPSRHPSSPLPTFLTRSSFSWRSDNAPITPAAFARLLTASRRRRSSDGLSQGSAKGEPSPVATII